MKAYSLSRGLLFLGGAALLFLQNQVVAKPRSVWDGVEAVMKDCDDFGEGGEVTASGTVTILRPLHCKTPMVRGHMRQPGDHIAAGTPCITDQSCLFGMVWGHPKTNYSPSLLAVPSKPKGLFLVKK